MESNILGLKLNLNVKDEELNKDNTFKFYEDNIRLSRLTYLNKPLFYQDNNLYTFNHLVSFDDQNDKKTDSAKLCVNTPLEYYCISRCNPDLLLFPTDRMFCLYRAEKLPWIPAILEGIKHKEAEILNNLEIFSKADRRGNKRVYIRYQELNLSGSVDYVIILEEMKDYFKLITAYPVIFQGTKRQFSKWSKNSR